MYTRNILKIPKYFPRVRVGVYLAWRVPGVEGWTRLRGTPKGRHLSPPQTITVTGIFLTGTDQLLSHLPPSPATLNIPSMTTSHYK